MEQFLVAITWAFVLTNIDLLLVLTAFSADKHYRPVEVVVGLFIGFGVAMVGTVLAVLAAALFITQWLFLLGLIPLGMGIWGIARREIGPQPVEPLVATNRRGRIEVILSAVFGVSSWNAAVYIPTFARFAIEEVFVAVGLYLVGAAIWYVLAIFLAREARILGSKAWIDKWLVSTTLTIIGAYVVLSGLAALLL